MKIDRVVLSGGLFECQIVSMGERIVAAISLILLGVMRANLNKAILTNVELLEPEPLK